MALKERMVQGDVWRLFEVPSELDADGLAVYLQSILDRCAVWFAATSASLFLRTDESDEFRLSAVGGIEPTAPRDAVIKLGIGIAGMSLAEDRALLINDPGEHVFLRGRLRKYSKPLSSSMVVPLVSATRGGIGVLNLSRKEGLPKFRQQDLTLVRSIAQHVALAVSNARLFAKMNAAQAEAEAGRSKLESVFQCLGVAIFVTDAVGRLTELTPMASNYLAGGTELYSLAATSDALALKTAEALHAALTGRRLSLRAHDEAFGRTWSIVAAPLTTGGATIVLEELTEHEKVTKELARLNRLAEIGQMTAAIAHEIRNPLTGIRAAAQMIGEAPENASEFASIIDSEVTKLNWLCEEFLEFARPMVLRLKKCRLGSILLNVEERIRPQFVEEGVRLSVQIEVNEPTIEADELRMEQVMRNLLLNALQATAKGGAVHAGISEAGFWVEDTGKGMDKASVDKLFTPFFTTRANGTGLGLCNVRKIIDAHHGDIAVTSELGRGTRFTVRLGGRRFEN